MNRAAFVARYGGIYERSPWVAETVWEEGHGAAGPAALAAPMAAAVEAAGEAAQAALLRAHPDLAGRLALAGDLTPESAAEQAGAGLDRCSPEELAEFQRLNGAYTARFGFPFILAVRGHDRASILAAFRARVANPPEREFRTALDQVHRIARLRLAAMSETKETTA
ncbi:MAG: 2-oxo-4-hydroxy-4-carboxy-5-ureidoimidazoline decarboxylase [Pseudomonadota bacterium]